MVKVRDNTPWMTKEGINQEQWLVHLSQKNQHLNLAQIRHAVALSQIAGSHVATDTGLSCFQLGLMIADLLTDLSVDSETIEAAIVFNCVLYADLTLDDISEHLGPEIVKLVKGVMQMEVLSALQQDKQYGKSKQQIDNIRKMLLAMVDDVRVVLIKLAERLSVLREMESLPESLSHAIATEVMDVYAPLANRLGIGAFKWEMEDLSFKYLQPALYKQIAKGLNSTRLSRDKYVENIVSVLSASLQSQGLKTATVYGRSKHILSIYRKMLRKNLPLKEIYDATAIRVLVDTEEACYAVLSLVHTLWEPIASEFDDYIARPKANGYQSLHTAVFGPENKAFEVQIRTFQMHELAEMGVAAHWKYKEGVVSAKPSHERKIEWLREVLAWHKEMTDAAHMPATLEREFLDDRIYVFTPAGDVLDMPQGATALDFAYFLHTQIGHRCRGAKVNGNIVPLTYLLQTGDRVEVLASKEEKPSRDWINPHLHYLQTARAKAKVLHWFKMQDFERHVEQGKSLLEKELKLLGVKAGALEELVAYFHYKTLNDFYAALGRGDLKLTQILNRLSPPSITAFPLLTKSSGEKASAKPTQLKIEGVGNLLTTMARCCQPLPGDEVIGYVTMGRGVSIHRKDCMNIIHATEKQQQRFLQVGWGDDSEEKYLVKVLIKAFDRVDLLNDITAVLSSEKIHISHLKTDYDQSDNLHYINLTVSVTSLNTLSRLLSKLHQIPNVIEARREGESC